MSESLKENKSNLLGLDTLYELKNKVDIELDKYNRFVKEKPFMECLPEILQRIEDNRNNKNCNALKTNSFPSFNSGTAGLNPGNLVGIAGFAKNGKTTFGLNLILDFADQGLPAAVFSLEMNLEEIQNKTLAAKANVNYEFLRNPKKITDKEAASLIRYSAKENEKLFLYNKISTLNEIEFKVKRLHENYGLKVCLVDYLGLIKTPLKSRNNSEREREVSMLTASLKSLAMETDTVIIALSQLNRTGARDASSINLAESVGLLRDCDFLFTIYKPDLIGIETVTIGKETINITKNDFVVKLDNSRHTPNGKGFLLRLNENGRMKEIETNHPYLEKYSETEIGEHGEIIS